MSLNNKKIIVTGGAGFIGSRLVDFLLKKKFNVLNIDKLTYAASFKTIKVFNSNPKHFFFKTDINNSKLIKKIFNDFKPNAVFHLAAESHVDRSIKNSSAFIKTNIIGTHSLLQNSLDYFNNNKKKKFVFIHVSTDEVYGDYDIYKKPFDEDTPYNPSSPYSASKASSDHLVKSWGKTYGLPIIVTNCSNNYGNFQFPEKLIPRIIISVLNKKKIPIYGDGKNERDWLYIDDHIDALYKIFKKGKINNTYNIGTGKSISNLKIALKICNIISKINPDNSNFDYSKLITFVKDRPGHDGKYLVNYSKIKKALNWFPKFSLDKGLTLTVDWYLKNKNWWRKNLKKSY
jgi:dTDP-glucose 4,6-dehydratase